MTVRLGFYAMRLSSLCGGVEVEIQSRDVGVFSAGFDLFCSAAEAWGDWCDVCVVPLEISC